MSFNATHSGSRTSKKHTSDDKVLIGLMLVLVLFVLVLDLVRCLNLILVPVLGRCLPLDEERRPM